MKTIFDKTFDGINVKVYYLPELADLYLYVDDEMINKFFFNDDNFEEYIKSLFPEWLSELLSNSIDEITHELYLRLYNFWYGNADTFELLDLDFTPDVRDFLNEEFNKMTVNLEYADNFRYYQVGNIEQKKEYDRIWKSGCCGFEDKIVSFKGVDYKIGCNYGH